MRLYKISFSGHYPVGAGAIAVASSKEQAVDLFIAELYRTEPSLIKKNSKDNIEVTELSEVSTCCHIICNGDY